MLPERWNEIKDKLHEALQLGPARRETYLAEMGATDPDLQRELESLITFHERTGTDFLNAPLAQVASALASQVEPDALLGRRVGSYQIMGQIGVGGMGEVFRAFRADDEYKKQVAIKLVRAGQNSDFVVNRFKNERQILASLDHPNIACLLDGGTTEKGVPYFVMELIEGQPIDEYCDIHKLPTTERLKLFVQVCSAVQYAHQHLFIHRDIKPSNLLVTSDGVPKLLDFGIAKILEGSAFAAQFEPTLTVFRVLTPGYSSPEQIKGEAITTASDVYSLGVVLYELLSGRSPYRVASHTPHELSRAVCEVEPEKPSVVVRQAENGEVRGAAKHIAPARVSAVRDGSPEKLSRRLSGDLDNIVQMALRKEPQRRYASVEQLAEDVRRHLEHLPVNARKDTFSYRASKFILRQRTGVAAALVVALTILAGLGVTLRQAHIARQQADIAGKQRLRAERRFNDVRKLANSLIDLRDPIRQLPGSVQVEKMLVDTGLQYLDSLAQEAEGDSPLQLELAEAYKRLGDAQGSPYTPSNLGDSAGALASYRKALRLRQTVSNSAHQDILDQTRLSSNYRTIGSLLMKMGDLPGARENARQALQITQALMGGHEDDPRVLREASTDLIALADAEGNDSGSGFTEKPELELQYHLNALELNRRWASLQPTESLAQQGIAYLDGRIAADLVQCGKPGEAIEHGRQALKILEKLASGSDATPNAWLENELAAAHSHLGDAMLLSGNPREAVTEYRVELAKFKYLSQVGPRDAETEIELGSAWFDMGKALASSERAKTGLQYLSKGVEIEERQLASDPKRSEIASILGSGYVFQGEALEKMGDEPSALLAYAKASRLFEAPPFSKADDLVASLQIAAARAKVAAALTKLGRLDKGRDGYLGALQLVELAAVAKPPNALAQYILADIYAGLGDLASKRPSAGSARKEACAWYRKSLDLWRQLPLRTGMAPNRFDLLAPASVAQRLAMCNEASAIAGH